MTTVCGIVGAATLAVANVPGIPPNIHMVGMAVSAACVAALGWHAQDRSGKPPVDPGTTVAIILAVGLVFSAGCKVGGLGLSVKAPPFGSVGLSLDGGVIGHGRLTTNAPALPPSLD